MSGQDPEVLPKYMMIQHCACASWCKQAEPPGTVIQIYHNFDPQGPDEAVQSSSLSHNADNKTRQSGHTFKFSV